MKILLYSENGTLKAEFFSQTAEKFILLIIEKTKQIKLKSGEKAFEYTEKEAFGIGADSMFTIFIRKGDFFTIE
jgi:hypothetical protein